MKLGILGGTFDPLHIGHMIIAQEAQARLGLDEVWFVPTGRPWMKEGSDVSASHHRVAMLRLALECTPGFKVSTVEVDRAGLSYTLDTLTALLEGEAQGRNPVLHPGNGLPGDAASLEGAGPPLRSLHHCSGVSAGPRGVRQGVP